MDIAPGKRVKVSKFMSDAGGMYFPPQHRGLFLARKDGVSGIVLSTDWTYAFEKALVRHDDGSEALYNQDELEFEREELKIPV